MNLCPYCQRTLPGFEKVCKDCYDKLPSAQPSVYQSVLGRLAVWPSGSFRNEFRLRPAWWLLTFGIGLALYPLVAFAGRTVCLAVFLAAAFVILLGSWEYSWKMSRSSLFYRVLLLVCVVSYTLNRYTGRDAYLYIATIALFLAASYIVIEQRRGT